MAEQSERPAPAAKTTRVQVDKLTETEKNELEAQGVDVSRDFVDVELAPPAPRKDPAEPSRREEVKKLESVVERPVDEKTPQEAGTAAVSEDAQVLADEVERLKKELQSRPDECPRCSWPVKQSEVPEPTDEDIASFLESVCAGDAFSKTYELYGGKFVARLRTRYSYEMELIRQEIDRLSEGIMSQDMMVKMDEMVFMTSVAEVQIGDKSRSFMDLRDLMANGESGDLYKELSERMGELPSQLRVVLNRCYIEFSLLVDTLMARAHDPKYWRGTSDSC